MTFFDVLQMEVQIRLSTDMMNSAFLKKRIDNRNAHDYITTMLIKIFKSDRRNDHDFIEQTRNGKSEP